MPLRPESKVAGIYKRNRRLLNNVVGTYVVKGGSVLVSLLTLPAYMRYFPDHAVLGLWFALLSVLQWVLTFDLGIGNGLRNLLVPAIEAGDWPRAQRFMSSGYMLIGLVSVALLATGAVAIPFIDWAGLLGVPGNVVPADTLVISAAVLFGGVVAQFWLRTINSVLLALERTALSNALSLASSLMILVFVATFPTRDVSESLVALTLANVVLVNAPLMAATVVVFARTLKEARPRLAFVNRADMRSVLRLGGTFFWIQLMLLAASGTNDFLIASWFGTPSVVEYQVYYRLLFLIVTLFSLVANPIWSAVSTRNARGRLGSVRGLAKASVAVSVSMIALNLLILACGQWVVNVWLRENSIDLALDAGLSFVFWSAVTMMNMAVSAIANGLGLLRPQLYGFALAALLKIPVSLAVGAVVGGWVSVVLANGLILLPYLVFQVVALRRFLGRGLTPTA